MKTEIQDFPAAHSMDTSWFGVDENGEIAIFETSETGTVPHAGSSLTENATWNDFFQGFPTDEQGFCCIPVDSAPLAELCDPNEVQNRLKEIKQNDYLPDYLILLLNPEKPWNLALSDEEMNYEKPLKFKGEQHVLLLPCFDIPIETIETAIINQEIIGIAPLKHFPSSVESAADAQGITSNQYIETVDKYARPYIEKNLSEMDDDWFYAYLGVHIYGPDEDTGAYEAMYRPHSPLNVADLSKKHQKNFGLAQFNNISFSKTAAIQPKALMKCYDYGGECEYWLTIDGKVLSKQKFKKGQLLKEDKTPYSQEEIHRMAFRQIGELPIDPDTIEWPCLEEETKNNMASSKEGVFQKLFKRFFSL